ncbi:MAG: prolyl oligopeptidase family serine peptidase [Pseudomonadota bacterium]
MSQRSTDHVTPFSHRRLRRSGAPVALWMLLGTWLIGCASPPPTAPGTAAPPAFAASDLFETTSYLLPGGYAWAPDDDALLLGSDETGIFNAYAIDPASGGSVPLTANDDDSVFVSSWFPNDRRILFSADSGGDELNHLFVRELDGSVTDLTPGDNLKAGFAGWSATGDAFFVSSNERDASAVDIYRYATDGYERTLIFENTAGFAPVGVSPDGRYVALLKLNSSADSDLFLADTGDDAAPVEISPVRDGVEHGFFAFTPDSREVVYSTNEHGEFVQAWRYAIDGGARERMIEADWDVMFVRYSHSGRYRVWGVNEDATARVRIFDAREGAEVRLPGLPAGNLRQVRFSRDESKLAFLLNADTSPSDLYTFDLGGVPSAQRLTRALSPAIDESLLIESRVVRYPSFDDLDIPGLLYRPRNASADNPVPALVWVHGGPGGQSASGYSALRQHLVSHGYALLAANNRGSSGYGKTFFHLDDRRHGEVDLQDIVYAKRYLASLPWVDSDRIGIIGGSYGGYMVGAALAFEPDVFDVGVNIFGVMNWVRTLKSIPPWWGAARASLYDELGDPATDEERLHRISPLFHTDNIRAPLLVVQGANDPRVLQVESDEIVAAVRGNGVPVEYVLFDDEGHGFTKRANRIAASDAYVEFLDAHL